MPKYVAGPMMPMGDEDEYLVTWKSSGTATVYEAEAKPVDTGLLNAHGVKLYRVEERNPIGFSARIR